MVLVAFLFLFSRRLLKYYNICTWKTNKITSTNWLSRDRSSSITPSSLTPRITTPPSTIINIHTSTRIKYFRNYRGLPLLKIIRLDLPFRRKICLWIFKNLIAAWKNRSHIRSISLNKKRIFLLKKSIFSILKVQAMNFLRENHQFLQYSPKRKSKVFLLCWWELKHQKFKLSHFSNLKELEFTSKERRDLVVR